MEGYENPASSDLAKNSNKGLVMDDNTGDLKRIYGVDATASADFYKHGRRGGNVLYGDGSVRWLPDPLHRAYVPESDLGEPEQYARIWQWVDSQP